MNASIYKISLDIHKTVSQTQINVVKDDNKRRFIFTLYEDGKPFILGNDCTAKFRAKKPDGTTVFNNCTIVDNTIIYDLTNQTTAAEGIVECEVALYGLATVNDETVSKLLTSPRFTMRVAPNLDNTPQVESEDEFTALQVAIGQVMAALNETDNLDITVTKVGGTATVTVTHKDGTSTSVDINDGAKGTKGNSVTEVEINQDGELVITVYDYAAHTQSVYNLGNVIGAKGDKGDKGDTGATGYSPNFSATAEVSQATGTPYVNVTKEVDSHGDYTFSFSFSGIKGEKGDKGDKGDKGEGGNTLYRHNIYFAPYQYSEIWVLIITKDNTPFTTETLKSWLTENGFITPNNFYPATGYARNTNTPTHSSAFTGICVNTQFNQFHLADVAFDDGTGYRNGRCAFSGTITDEVSEI